MTTSANLPDTTGIDPNAPVVKFELHECRTCHARSDWYREDDSRGDVHDWSTGHSREVGHRQFYAWSITRGTSRVVWMPNVKKDKKP